MPTSTDKSVPAKPKRMTGARPSSRAALASATPYRMRGVAPAMFLVVPQTLSMWLNSTVGDCVTAEESFAKACSGILISDATVKTWATQNDVLNGADLDQVLKLMLSGGFKQDGNTYDDGPAVTVDWTNAATLQNALTQGPVKIGVAAAQLQNSVGDTNGWLATGFTSDQQLDHCTSLCGFGTVAWLLQQLGGSPPPAAIANNPAYALFTWDTIGVIDVPSLLAICGEAWLRNPTTVTVGTNPPAPDKVVVYPAGPTPPPGPGPIPPPPPPAPSPIPPQYQWALQFAQEVYQAYGPRSVHQIARMLQMFGVPSQVILAIVAELGTEGGFGAPKPFPGPHPFPYPGPHPFYPGGGGYYPGGGGYYPGGGEYPGGGYPPPYPGGGGYYPGGGYPYPGPGGGGGEVIPPQYVGLPWVIAALARGVPVWQIVAAIAAGQML